MLEFIREKMKGVFATVIVGFFCAIFALWGVESLFDAAGKQPAVATVNGEEITEPELTNAINVMRQRYAQMLGGKVDPGFLNDKMLREPALDSLINQKLLTGHVEDMKMTVGSVTVDKAIVRDPLFAADGKKFDPAVYKEKLREYGLTAAAYQAQLRQQMILGHLQQGIAATAFVTARQVEDVARLASQARTFDYVKLEIKNITAEMKPDDQAVEDYYKKNQDSFLTEEEVSIEYLELDRNSLISDVDVPEEDIRAIYDKEAAAFKPVAERRAAHILIESQADGSEKKIIEKVAARLRAGDKFEKLAREFSKDEGSAAQGGDVGFTAGETFVPEFEQALAALRNEGDVSDPVKTEFGYHFIKLLEQRQTSMPSYDERKPEIANQLKQAKATELYGEKLDQFSEATYSAGDLAGPALELQMTVQKSAPFGRRGGVGIAGQQKVIDAAFSPELLDSGKNSQVIELSAGKAVVLRVASHELPKLRDLSEVKPEILEALKQEYAGRFLREKAESIKARLQAGEKLADLARTENLVVSRQEALTRAAVSVDKDILDAVFRMNKPAEGGASADVAQLSNGDWAVIRLDAVAVPELNKEDERYRTVESRMQSGAANVDYALYEQALRNAAKIVRRDAGGENPVEAGR